jgi:uncharacterized protein YndB with AHSA1/START domain
MKRLLPGEIDPKLDLVLERTVDVPPELVWKAWTEPEHLVKWFTPAPWKTVECEIELRPGGIFRTVMESPEGQRFPGTGCYLEVVPEEKLVWTSVMGPGFRPVKKEGGEDCMDMAFTAVILLEAVEGGTKYTAVAIHGEEASRKRHEEMGFHDGWSAVLDQLVALVKTW